MMHLKRSRDFGSGRMVVTLPRAVAVKSHSAQFAFHRIGTPGRNFLATHGLGGGRPVGCCVNSVVRVKRCTLQRVVERTVEIVEEPGRPYKWFAIEQGTRQSLLRLSDLNQLRDVCDRLGWKVVDVKRAPGIGTTVARQRSTRSKR